MIYISFLLHIYQPPGQLNHVLNQIVNECYRPLFKFINSREDSFFTLNINWSLTEKLIQKGYNDVISLIKEALSNKLLEITGTAAYHPILPLIPNLERLRQINLNYEKSREIFGENYNPKGFFPPEMAFGPEIIDDIKNLGYKWTITDDIPYSCIHKEVPFSYIASADALPVFLRSNFWSNKISFEKNKYSQNFKGSELANMLINDLTKWFNGKDGYIIIAMDGETFGHHIKGYINYFLESFLDTLSINKYKIKLIHIRELLNLFPVREKEIPPGSWSTSAKNFWDGDFFPLWRSKYNYCQELLWKLTDMALSSVQKLQEELDKSLNSCTFWWCAVKPEELSPMTVKGMDMLIKVIRNTNSEKLAEALEIKRKLINYMTKERKEAAK